MKKEKTVFIKNRHGIVMEVYESQAQQMVAHQEGTIVEKPKQPKKK